MNLKIKSKEMRKYIQRAIEMSGGGHAGGSLSIVEVLASLYFGAMRHDPNNPEWEERDRFILSKGHAGLGLYAALSLAGYFPKEWIDKFASADGILMNHPEAHLIPGVEISTGSLGHGLSLAVGIALAGKLKKKEYFTFTIIGDGESHEGSIWEAAMAASHFKLKRIIAILDRNHIGNDGDIDRVMNLEPLNEKWQSFGWKIKETDGHDANKLKDIILGFKKEADGPYMLIANTVKGKGLINSIAGTGLAHYIKGSQEEIRNKFI